MASPVLIVGGIGSVATLADVARVARGGAVQLDTAASKRIDKQADKKIEPLDPAASGDNDAAGLQTRQLTKQQARAAALSHLLPLVNGSSGVRLGLVELIVRQLAPDAQPLHVHTGSEEAMAAQILAAAAPLSGGFQPIGHEQAVLSSGVSAAEAATLKLGQSSAAGVAALSIADAQLLVAAASPAVSALSAEALQAQAVFEPEEHAAAPPKSAVAAAAELTGMLAGSSLVNPRKGGAGTVNEIASAPQDLGWASDSLAAAATLVKAELSAAPPPAAKQGRLPRPSRALAAALTRAAEALSVLVASSAARSALIAKQMPSAEELARDAGQVCSQLDEWPATAAAAGRSDTAAVAAALWLADTADALPFVLACEALAAAEVLREKLQVAPAEEGAKEKKPKKGAGMALGRGCEVVWAALKTAISAPPSAADGPDHLAIERFSLKGSPMQKEGRAISRPAGGKVSQAVEAVVQLLDPAQPDLQRLQLSVRAVLEANQAARKPKLPKGTRDLTPDQMMLRAPVLECISAVFRGHGAVSIQTPVFELRETLMGKYGEDSKLIYDLQDQGGEILSLRYDLTVPFARYLALNGVSNIKRYHIAQVYRRDNPQMARGRFREFYQCDIDIAGAYPSMVPDAEILQIVSQILKELKLEPFTIKLNHRRLLDAMLAVAGVPAQKFRPICSAIDKLDKAPWEEVRQEMVVEKGLPEPVADRIGQFVVLKGKPWDVLKILQAEGHPLNQNPDGKAALEEMQTLFGFVEAFGALDHISFDLSLARGLDYYTGIIYEAVLDGENVGSIAAGGRYDNLVGMFSGKQVPAVGISVGLERVFSVLEARIRAQAAAQGGFVRTSATQVLVCSLGSGLQPKRMEIAATLWESGIAAEYGYKANMPFPGWIKLATDAGIPFMVLFGNDELSSGTVKLKTIAANTEETVKREDLVAVLKERIQQMGPASAIAAGAPGPK